MTGICVRMKPDSIFFLLRGSSIAVVRKNEDFSRTLNRYIAIRGLLAARNFIVKERNIASNTPCLNQS